MTQTNTPTNPEFDSLLPGVGFNRRSFVVTALGAGFALAMQPVAAQTAIKTDTDGLVAGEIKIPVADGDMVAYRAAPTGNAKAPVVLVVSEIFGVHEYIADVCRRLAKLGYMAIAPELFARYGDPRTLKSIPEIQSAIISKVPDAGVMADLDATVAWAAANGGDSVGNSGRLAITGFCWGGRITWLYAAHNPAVKTGVAWYGRLAATKNALTPQHPLDIAAQIKTPVLGLYGGDDKGIPLPDVDAMRAALKTAGNASQIHVYDGAPHAFHADYRPSYRKEPAEDGWKRLQDWLRAHGV